MDNHWQEKMQPIKEGLFGKQPDRKAAIPPKPTKLYSATQILRDLSVIPEEDWGKYAFSRELLVRRIPETLQEELTLQAIACGREWAEKTAAQYGSRDIQTLAEKVGLVVDFPVQPQSIDRVLFAEFRVPNKVHVFTDALDKIRPHLLIPAVQEVIGGEQDIIDLLIGHELFHYIEEKNKKSIWTRTYKINLWEGKLIPNYSGIGTLGEIAAMAFSKQLKGISYSPYVLDAFLIYGYTREAATELYLEMLSLMGRQPSAQSGGDPDRI